MKPPMLSRREALDSLLDAARAVEGVNVRLDVRQRRDQFIAQAIDALCQLAGKLCVGGGQRQFRPRMNQIGHGFRLREVNAAIEKGAFGKFAGQR